jgi:transposase
VAGEFFRTVVAEARALKLTSDEHFTVDGTLIEAWASL